LKKGNSLPHRTFDFILGFLSTAVFEIIVGCFIAIVTLKVNPDLFGTWGSALLATKLMIVASGFVIPILFSFYLWRSRQFISIGILAYIAIDLLLGILG